MLYALLVLTIGTINLLIGFAAAVRLGWGPCDRSLFGPNWSPDSAESTSQVTSYGSELDLQRLIDFGDQRSRRLKNSRVEAAEPFQRGLHELQIGFDLTLMAVETAEARLMAAEMSPPSAGWASMALAFRTDVLEGYERIEKGAEAVHQSLGARDQHRLLGPRTALTAWLRKTRPQWHAWNPEAEEIAPESIEELLQLVRNVHGDLRELAAPIMGILHDILGETRPVMDWDPSLHRDAGHGMQTVVALDADRRINPAQEAPYFLACIGIDQVPAWRPRHGRLLFHAVGDRFAERLGQHLPAHWMIVPLGEGDFLVRGEATTIDEFTIEMDRMRQRIGRTEVRVGSLKLPLTVSGIVINDNDVSPTEFQLVEMQRLLKAVQKFGGDRIFICDGTTEVPVMPLAETFESAVLEI